MAHLRHGHARIAFECRRVGNDAFGTEKNANVKVPIWFVGGEQQRGEEVQWALGPFNAY